MLDESTYNGLVAGIFKRLLEALDAADPDVVEGDSTGDMLTITSRAGEKVVVMTAKKLEELHTRLHAFGAALLDDCRAASCNVLLRVGSRCRATCRAA